MISSEASLPALVEASAARTPGAIAVVDGNREITYAELAQEMRRIAALLGAEGITRGDRVGVLLPKSIESVIGLLGAMRAGAAYVPVDPGAPMRRARAILGDAWIAALITAGAELARREGLLDGEGAPAPRLILCEGAPPADLPAALVRRLAAPGAASPIWPTSSTPPGPPASPRASC